MIPIRRAAPAMLAAIIAPVREVRDAETTGEVDDAKGEVVMDTVLV